MSGEKNNPQFDPTRVKFPTDQITLGEMRRREPLLFSHRNLGDIRASSIDALATHCWEQYLAEKAFASELKAPDPHPNERRSDIIALLDGAYRAYGISAGFHETRQAAARIEAASHAQAKTYRSRAR